MAKCHCGQRAYYGKRGGGAERCKKHKEGDMIDCHNPRCWCGKLAIFGTSGGKAERCKKHKGGDMVDVRSKRCRCKRSQPVFGYLGKKAECCQICKLPNMVDVKNRRCACGKSQPNYALPGEKAGFCAGCKGPAMVDVNNGRCFCGKVRPTFAFPGDRAAFCMGCKLPGMVDVKSLRCKCGKHQPRFGLPGGRPTCCSTCKEDGMTDLRQPLCSCGESAYYGSAGGQAVSCIRCRAPNMVPSNRHTCIVGACEPIKKVHFAQTACYECRERIPLKVWERKVVDELKRLGIEYSYYDSSAPCAQAKGVRAFRPDFTFVLDDYVVILEVDENEHRNYELSCEVGRVGDIKDAIELPLLLIRLNPSEGRIKMLQETMKWAFAMGEAVKAQDAGLILAYHGYSDSRRLELHEQMVGRTALHTRPLFCNWHKNVLGGFCATSKVGADESVVIDWRPLFPILVVRSPLPKALHGACMNGDQRSLMLHGFVERLLEHDSLAALTTRDKFHGET